MSESRAQHVRERSPTTQSSDICEGLLIPFCPNQGNSETERRLNLLSSWTQAYNDGVIAVRTPELEKFLVMFMIDYAIVTDLYGFLYPAMSHDRSPEIFHVRFDT